MGGQATLTAIEGVPAFGKPAARKEVPRKGLLGVLLECIVQSAAQGRSPTWTIRRPEG